MRRRKSTVHAVVVLLLLGDEVTAHACRRIVAARSTSVRPFLHLRHGRRFTRRDAVTDHL